MKKVFLITDCLTEGVGKHVTDLYINLSKNKNYDIYVLYGKERFDEKYIKLISDNHRIPIESFRRSIGLNDIKTIKEIKKLIKEMHPDIVHCHSSKAGLTGRIAAKIMHVKKIIYSPHAYFFLKYNDNSLKQKIFLMAEKILSKFFTHFTIATSIGEYDTYLKYKIDNVDKCTLIKHGLVEPIISDNQRKIERKKMGVADNNILIGAMARFEYQKNPINTFKILDKISKENKNVKCVFWGSGSMYDDVKNLSNKLNSSVLLPGNTSIPDVHLKCLDIYLTASFYEGLPYTLIESLALKLPIVASNVVGNVDGVIDSENGYLFSVDDCDEAVSKLQNIINNNYFNFFANGSYKLFKKKFSIDKMIKEYEKLYGDDNG